MKPTHEMLMAYVDGELDGAEKLAVEQAIGDDPQVASEVASARLLRERIQQAYAPVLEEAVPARLLTAASKLPAPGRSWGVPAWAGMAASLLLGLLLSPLLLPEKSPALLDMSGRALVAGGELAESLDRRLAADAATGSVAIGLTFRARDGAYCRTFTLASPQSMAGLACREGGQWIVSAMQATSAQSGDLRRASSQLPAAVLAEVDARIQGDTLDADGERDARDAGWKQAR